MHSRIEFHDATFTGASGVLEAANLVGLSVMFAGFLLIG